MRSRDTVVSFLLIGESKRFRSAFEDTLAFIVFGEITHTRVNFTNYLQRK